MDARPSFDNGNPIDRAGLTLAPPDAPLDMPAQTVAAERVPCPGETDGRWRLSIIVGVALLITGFAAWEMYFILGWNGMTPIKWFVFGLFAMNFSWIASAATTAAAGGIYLLAHKKWTPPGRGPFNTSSRTVIIVPMYNEWAAKVAGGAEAIYDSLKAAGAEKAFDIFFLSDTTNPELIKIEEQVFRDLVRRRAGEPFYYRRRAVNRRRKSGNVEEFVRRWGGRYDYMVVFDADSIMSASALTELVRRMDAKPRTALIQTLPIIVNSQTVFARMQQFSLRAYGVLFTQGLSWWSGGSGNFWGHNAIVRVKAFAAHASLPDLPGKAPLGGPILSHDFVEAALLRRAGWRVEIAADIDGSYEETPPTLIDLAARDRRWAQGNLQHIPLLFAKGYDNVSRAHITAGVMGYASAALWMTLVIAGTVLAWEGRLADPMADPAIVSPLGASTLLFLTLTVVLSPKWMTLIVWAFGKLPGWKRTPRFVAGLLVETLHSAITAPIQMFSQTIAIVQTLIGQDGGWRPQVRDRKGFAMRDLIRNYLPHTVLAALLFVFSLDLSTQAAISAAPMAISLFFAAPISFCLAWRLTDNAWVRMVTETPEESDRPSVLEAAERSVRRLEAENPEAAVPPTPAKPVDLSEPLWMRIRRLARGAAGLDQTPAPTRSSSQRRR
jgi:membrane glycosyltransferase